jgi:hypothetical protein
MQLRSVAGKAALNIAISVSLLIVGIGGGAALGLLKGPASAAAAVPSGATQNASVVAPAEAFVAAGLTVQEAPAAPAAVRKVVRRVVAQNSTGGSASGGAAPTLSVNVPGAAGTSAASNANCGAKLDDAKINWLLNLVAKAKASNPDQAATADRIAGQLRSAMGQNMCAEQAQIHISNMCADKGTKEFMALMVKELPFFIRPMVGDPCKHDLVAAANKWLPSS